MAVMDVLEARGGGRCLALSDPPSGLRAWIVLDDLTLGPAAGGVRTLAYPDEAAAVADAARLAAAMTLKCALAGLDAGGGKAVVRDHPGLDRPRAFRRLGAFVEELGGLFRTAGDAGTTAADLAAMAATTRYVHPDEGPLAASVARGVVACLRALCDARPGARWPDVTVAVQGCGAIGDAVARACAEAGAGVLVADLDRGRADAVARQTGAAVLPPDRILAAEADLLVPCALGGVLTREVAEAVRAWGVCPAANNAVAEPAAEDALLARGVRLVPDVVASAGAVVDGIGRSVMGLADRGPLIERLGEVAREILARAGREGARPSEVAEAMARARLASRRG